MNSYDTNDGASCPVPHGAPQEARKTKGPTNQDWWPSQLDLTPLLAHNSKSDPYSENFDYVKEFNSLDLTAVKKDIVAILHESKSWWPADYGNYGPFMIRMAWHSAGTYRVSDGRGGGGQGLQRFAPLNSWPDNVNLDKARRLLWPIKQKYGKKLSWADLMILAGNVALEDMGFKTFGFAGGRADVWEPDNNTYWGTETEWLANKRYDETRDADTLEHTLAAVQMGLIYVNPEGPDGNPDFKLSAADIRVTFGRMAMNDEETVALIAGGHAFGKTHGAGDASQVDSEPEASPFENVGLGWSNSQGKGHSEDTISSGLEVTWSTNPTQWDNNYLELMYKYEWTQVESPAGAIQWAPIDCEEQDMAPHAHLPGVKVIPNMLTTDLALRFGDEKYNQICKDFLEDFDYFSDTFARAWFKLTHRDMGPRERYQGAEVPSEILIWQDPVQENNNAPLSGFDLEELDGLFEESSMSTRGLLNTAWSSASSFRNTDKRGGATGARIFLEPQRSWPVNNPITIAERQAALQVISDKFSGEISMSDLIVYGGVYAIKKALAASSVHVDIPFYDGRGDATQEQTDIESFNYLYPVADAFTNWCHPSAAVTLEEHLINKAALLGLTPVEMTALVGGLRGLAVSGAVREHGDFSENVGIFNNDYFKVLLDMDIVWVPSQDGTSYSAFSRDTREALMMSASRADLVFASNSVLRAYAEVYASADGLEKLAQDFVGAWTKVMNADLF